MYSTNVSTTRTCIIWCDDVTVSVLITVLTQLQSQLSIMKSETLESL